MKVEPEYAVRVPILRSIMAGDALGQAVAAAYGLVVTRCRLIKAMILDTYLVTTQSGPYILRIYPSRRRTLTQIVAELDVLDRLHSAGARVSVAVQQINGERMLKIDAPEGLRYAALFTYAGGHPLSDTGKRSIVQAFGTALAEIHTIADTLLHVSEREPLDLDTLLDHPLDVLEAAFNERSKDWAVLHTVADSIRPQIAALPRAAPSYGLCHGDVDGRNVHIDAGGHIMLFDFDFCGPGWRAYDVACFLMDEPPAVSEAFLAGYQVVRTLTREEMTCIPAFQIAQNIWLLGLRASYIDEWGMSWFSDTFVDRVLAFIGERMKLVEME